MDIQIFQIDAFTNDVFKGNPAAICPLEHWLNDDVLQSIAAENNLSETAFFVKNNEKYHLRWFTPASEVDLCGHATLATAWVLFNVFDYTGQIDFQTRSGKLLVCKKGEYIQMDFPLSMPQKCRPPHGLLSALAVKSDIVLSAEDYFVVLDAEEAVAKVNPDFNALSKISMRGVAVTAPGNQVDFVSRWFGPEVCVYEVPVTGSSHTSLAPYWSKVLGKTKLTAKQISQRGGFLKCELNKDRVLISGKAVKFMQGVLSVDVGDGY